MLVLGIVLGWIAFNAIILFGAIIYMIWECVKHARRMRWVREHDGDLIGSDAFFAWCEEHHVDPGYYW